jgi:hypothetical protein
MSHYEIKMYGIIKIIFYKNNSKLLMEIINKNPIFIKMNKINKQNTLEKYNIEHSNN